jgi:hypothetical protein
LPVAIPVTVPVDPTREAPRALPPVRTNLKVGVSGAVSSLGVSESARSAPSGNHFNFDPGATAPGLQSDRGQSFLHAIRHLLRLHESVGKWGGCLVGGAVSFVGLVVGFLLLIVVLLVTLSLAQQKVREVEAKYQVQGFERVGHIGDDDAQKQDYQRRYAAYEEEVGKQRWMVAAAVIIGPGLGFVAPIGLAILLWRRRVGKAQQELDRAIHRLVNAFPDEVEYFGGRSSLKNAASVQDLIRSLEAKDRV